MTSTKLKPLIFISFYLIGIAIGTRQHRICMQLESVDVDDRYESAYNGNRNVIQGKKGPKGDRGIPGAMGPPGVVDHDRLEDLVDEKVKQAFKKHKSEMNDTMNDLLKRIEQLEEENVNQEPTSTDSPLPSLEPTTKALGAELTLPPGLTEQDVVRYNGRIFVPLASEKHNKASAVLECQNIGGELANIYDQTHMDKLMTFIRNNKLREKRYKGFWLGMTYDPINKQLLLRNGTISQNRLTWYAGYPQNVRSHTSMYIIIEKSVSTEYYRTHQYIFNQMEQQRYVLCEI